MEERLNGVPEELLAVAVEFVRTERDVTFVELKRHFAERMEVDGDVALESAECPNLFWWVGMSEEFASLAQALARHPDVALDPCSWLVYMGDGVVLKMPLVKRPPENGYPQPHWSPCVFDYIPDKPEEEREYVLSFKNGSKAR
jgi:hypothetical protein